MGTLKALVVDDEELSRDLAVEVLRRKGLHVDAVSDDEEAMEMLESSAYDLVVSDVYFGGQQDGIEFAEAVVKKYPDIRVILMTAGVLENIKRLQRSELVNVPILDKASNRFIDELEAQAL